VQSGVRINVLGVREDGMWCAIALEMSLRGYGETFKDALKNLREAIVAQVAFAIKNQTVDSIFIPAEPHYFKRYKDLKHKALKSRFLNRVQPEYADYRVGSLPVPQPKAVLSSHLAS